VTGTTHDIAYLYPGADRWEWCVVALNGSLAGGTSACLRSQLDTPTLLSAQIITSSDVRLTWTAVPGTWFYRILFRDSVVGGNFVEAAPPVFDTTYQVGWLSPPGASRFEWCVVAVAPTIESARSNILLSHL